MTIAIRLTDHRWWHGAVTVEDLPDGGVRPWRVPHPDPRFDIGLVHDGTPAGVRLVASTTATALAITVRVEVSDPCPVDVVIDGTVQARLRLEPSDDQWGREGLAQVSVRAELPAGDKRVEIWLPQYGCTGVLAVSFDADAFPVEPTGPRWITYGSSITMCRQADGPATAWPSRVALRSGYDLLNLGYAGQALMDPPIARLIRDTPADLISLCLGINVQAQGSHTARSLLPAVMGFVETVLDGHPEVPVLAISPLSVRPERDVPGASGLTVSAIRDIVTDALTRVIEHRPAPHLRLVDGRTILGPDELDLLADTVHPTDAGCAVIADRIIACQEEHR